MGIFPQAGRPNRKGERRMAANKILIVDDDKNICELLRLYMGIPWRWPMTGRRPSPVLPRRGRI